MSYRLLYYLSLIVLCICILGCKIEGRIMLDGVGIEGVTVTLSGDTYQTTITDKNGIYRFVNIDAGQYTIIPSFAGYTFVPGSIEITKFSIDTDITRVNFDVSTKYFIITESEKFSLPKVIEFIDFKYQQGYEVITKTKEAIDSEYNGVDLAEKIRNYLINVYPESPIGYLLIIGSLDAIPNRVAYPDPENHSQNNPSKNIPTDFYYMDLDSSWDSDYDGYYGEYGDDEVDGYIELISGRIPFDEDGTIEAILERIMIYETSKDPYKKDVLIAGARLFIKYDTPLFINLTICCTILPSGYTEKTYYEDEIGQYCDGPLTTTSLIDDWASNDYGTVCLFSHGSKIALHLTDGVFLHTGITFRPTQPAVLFTSACNINDPARNDSLGMFLFKNGFVVSILGSSRVSLASKDLSTFCAQMKLAEYYFAQGNTLGHTILRGCQFLNNHIDIPTDMEGYQHYQNLYGFNIMGDPSMRNF